ncbi:carbon-nitrogen hydrolase family protein [Paralcaligenes ureilyticus]|uniref:Putative amidohydrolase n=1 Tax=Paralcaligenes ureilyticus TaxID=627131 RepID=A0A4R3M290_9BURK|nr:carbon-nitrogen hydrolase family protein [Paralcaligenes ureilyticus]TCT06329.1 putative amidohydrolase [Paralcaligenes ureilyticus]
MAKYVRVAAAQLAPKFMDLEGSLAVAESAIAEAGRNGAQLIAFPETWLPGFPLWIFQETGWRDERHKRAYAHLLANSIELGGPALNRLCRAARNAGVTVVMGANERDSQASRETLYNSLIYISSDGEILGVRRKLKPTHVERVIWGQGDGSGIRVYETSAGRVGGSICWEHWMPLNRFAMHALGEQIHVGVWPDVAEHNEIAARHYAFEGRCFVIAMGTILRRTDVQVDFGVPIETLRSTSGMSQRDDFILAGGTGIIGPDGKWVVEPVTYEEKIIYADLDLDRVTEEKLSLDTAGHYNRPDIFQLIVDDRPKEQIYWASKRAPGPYEDGVKQEGIKPGFVDPQNAKGG